MKFDTGSSDEKPLDFPKYFAKQSACFTSREPRAGQ